jgi:hypothetical protein
MIQRIQTLYLLIAAILMGLMLAMPLIEFTGINGVESEEFLLTACSFKSAAAEGVESVNLGNTLVMGVLIAAAALLPLVAIFLYKKRMLQYRLCLSETVLLVGVLVFIGFFIFRASVSLEGYDDSMFRIRPAAFFPVASIFFVWLAMRGIIKDARLIKSLDRIR